MYKLPPPKPMSKMQIVAKADRLWEEYIKEVGWGYVIRNGIKFDDVYEALIYPKYEVIVNKNENLGVDDSGELILGQFLPKENTALINSQLFETKDPRLVFTEWHEAAGHGILHGAFLRRCSSKLSRLNTTERNIDTFLKHFENSFERQANIFAANIAAPRVLVACIYLKIFDMKNRLKYRGSGYYTFSVNGHNFKWFIDSPFDLAYQMSRFMKHYFGGLSVETLAYQNLEATVDIGNYGGMDVKKCVFAKTVGDILRELRS